MLWQSADLIRQVHVLRIGMADSRTSDASLPFAQF